MLAPMKKIAIVTLLAFAAVGASAEEKFLQLSLTPEIALQSRDTTITGLSLNIWGENPHHAVSIGFVNGTSGDSSGFCWGLYNYSEKYTGLSWAFVNYSSDSFKGVQLGTVNIAKQMNGLQWGMVNYAESLHGVQIGFANIAMNNPWFTEFPSKLAKGFPFVNWSF
jgi:hypothetical protein